MGNLILTRKRGEKIVVRLGDNEVIIEVTQIKKCGVQVRVSADKSIRIDRKEVDEKRRKADAA